MLTRPSALRALVCAPGYPHPYANPYEELLRAEKEKTPDKSGV
jgi:hypothetical protein